MQQRWQYRKREVLHNYGEELHISHIVVFKIQESTPSV
jgi:hypothetical protein